MTGCMEENNHYNEKSSIVKGSVNNKKCKKIQIVFGSEFSLDF